MQKQSRQVLYGPFQSFLFNPQPSAILYLAHTKPNQIVGTTTMITHFKFLEQKPNETDLASSQKRDILEAWVGRECNSAKTPGDGPTSVRLANRSVSKTAGGSASLFAGAGC